MGVHAFLHRTHRVIAGLFLVATVPAAIVSTQGDASSPWVYAPLPFLFGLMITGTYLLVRPWVLRVRASRHPHETGGE